jgi:hypothetical protein
MCRGSSLCCSSFGLVVCALFLSMVCLGCVEPLPSPKRSETCSSSTVLALCLSFGFRSLVGVSFSSVFSFLSSLWLPNLVCCQCAHQGGD